MERLFIFDGKTETLITVAGNTEQMMPFYDALSMEQINQDFTLEFSVPFNHPEAVYVKAGNIAGYLDRDGDLQAFNIYKTEEEHTGSELRVRAYCEHLFYELLDDVVVDKRVVGGTALEAVQDALFASRWQVGTVADLGTANINFYYNNALNNLREVVNKFGGELRFRLTYNGGAITGRYVDLLARRGTTTGKRFEYTKDLESVKRTVDMSGGLKTALYGRGKSSELETGGFTRLATFKDVVWSVANGDPVDKPAGQEWVGDPSALALYGRNNGTIHRFGIVEFSEIEDPEQLLLATWQELQKVNKPRLTYEVVALDLEQLAGYSHEAVRLGDTVFVIDRDLGLTVEARIVELTRHIDDPSRTEIKLGNFTPLFVDIAMQLDSIGKKLSEKEGIWDNATMPVTDGDIEVVAPTVPTGLTASGLFTTINVKWDFNPALYVAGYELYGSKTSGFTPSASNLIFRGKAGGYTVQANPNETWYFKVRAFNPAGMYSDYTAQVSGTTAKINGSYIANASIGNAQIGTLSADKINGGTINGTNVNITNLNADNITAGKLQAQYVVLGAQTTFENGYNPAPIIKGFMDEGFVHGKAFWADTTYTGEVLESTTYGTIVPSTESTLGPNIYQITGQKRLFGKNAIPVDVNRKYKVTFRVRQTVEGATGTNRVYAGVATLDANYQPITGGAGTHRYCAVNGRELTVAEGWQVFEGVITGVGDTETEFRAGTVYVRPVFMVNYQSGTGTAEIDYVKFEDITEINALEERVKNAELKITDESILTTVTSSQAFKDKVDVNALSDYATTSDLITAEGNAKKYVDDKVSEIDFSPYALKSELEQTADAINLKFSSSGGVNLIKNSVGYAGNSFWVPSSYITSFQNEELEQFGAGSGWKHIGTGTVNSSHRQVVKTAIGSTYTISCLIKKTVTSASNCYVYLQVWENGVKKVSIGVDSNETTNGYQKYTYTFETQYDEIEVRLVFGYLATDAVITSVMLNVGTVPLQWQNSTGEVYNSNVQMDLNGITVHNNVYNGYTAITPTEFAGYAEVDGNMEKVFTLNKDVTEISKAKLEKEITMAPIKVVPVTGTYNGWAFVAE